MTTMLNDTCHEHHQEHNQHVYSIPPYDYAPSLGSYAITPLSPLPPLPSEINNGANDSPWSYQPNTYTYRETNNINNDKIRAYQQFPPASDGRQRLRRQRTKLRQLPTHQQPNSLKKTWWADEGTVCYQVEAKGVSVTRRADNNMVNGTKLLNAVGMSRGKRDGILKNARGRQVVKVGSMVLKGIWITIEEARELAVKFELDRDIYPLLEPYPEKLLTFTPPFSSSSSSNIPAKPIDHSPHYYHYYPYQQQPATASTTMKTMTRGTPPSPVPQIRHTDDAIVGDAELNHTIHRRYIPHPPPSPLSSTTSLTGTEAATVTTTYHPIPASLPPVSYFHPYMMHNFLPKYAATTTATATTTYNVQEDQQQQQNQAEFNGVLFHPQPQAPPTSLSSSSSSSPPPPP